MPASMRSASSAVDVYVSEDKLEPEAARRLALLVPPFVAVTLVTHFTDPDEILRLADFVGVDTIQLHGDVTPAQTAAVRPYAVDANSGVEDDGGDKSADGARAFVRSVRAHGVSCGGAGGAGAREQHR